MIQLLAGSQNGGDLASHLQGEMYFGHGDITKGNILIKKAMDGKWCITGFIDWDSAGWFPKPWQTMKWQMVFEVSW